MSVVLSSLSASVRYFAHVVVSSPTGRVSSPDVAFTTLTDQQGDTRRGGGRHRVRSRRARLQRRSGNRDGVPPARCLECDPGRRLRRSATARRRAVQRRLCERLRCVVRPELGAPRGQSRIRWSAITSTGSPGAGALFPVLRRVGRDAGSGVVLLRPRLLARDRTQRQLRSDRWRLRRRLARGGLAARRPRRPPRRVARSRTGTSRCSPRVRNGDPGGAHDLGRSLRRRRGDRAQRPRTRLRALRAAEPRRASATTSTASASSSSAQAARTT